MGTSWIVVMVLIALPMLALFMGVWFGQRWAQHDAAAVLAETLDSLAKEISVLAGDIASVNTKHIFDEIEREQLQREFALIDQTQAQAQLTNKSTAARPDSIHGWWRRELPKYRLERALIAETVRKLRQQRACFATAVRHLQRKYLAVAAERQQETTRFRDEPNELEPPQARFDITPEPVVTPAFSQFDPINPTYERYTPPPPPPRSEIETLIELYNQANEDKSLRERFRERYEPVRVGAVNAVERRKVPDTPPQFATLPDGELFGVQLNGESAGFVMPRFGLTIEAVNFAAGAIGEIFTASGFDTQRHYSRFRLICPAKFNVDGERWRLQKPGTLELGPGA